MAKVYVGEYSGISMLVAACGYRRFVGILDDVDRPQDLVGQPAMVSFHQNWATVLIDSRVHWLSQVAGEYVEAPTTHFTVVEKSPGPSICLMVATIALFSMGVVYGVAVAFQ